MIHHQLLLLLLSIPTVAAVVKNGRQTTVKLTPKELHAIGATFAGISGRSNGQSYYVQPGSFTFLSSPTDCETTKQCMGSSKRSPVGVALVPFSFEENKRNIVHRREACAKAFMCGQGSSHDLSAAFRLASDEAIVLMGMTPPNHAEYSFNTLLYSRAPSRLNPAAAAQDGTDPIEKCTQDQPQRCVLLAPLASLSSQDITVEKVEWRSTFNQPVAIIVSASKNTTERLKAGLIDSGMPAQSINVLPVPSGAGTRGIHTGLEETSDMFTINLKMNEPQGNSIKFVQDYVQASSFTLFRFTPRPDPDAATAESPEENIEHFYEWSDVAPPTARTDRGGKYETFRDENSRPVDLKGMMDVLENEIIRSLEHTIVTKVGTSMNKGAAAQRKGIDCIQQNVKCHGRPYHHAQSVVVSQTVEHVVLGGSDKDNSATSVLVYGVLHQHTNLTNNRKFLGGGVVVELWWWSCGGGVVVVKLWWWSCGGVVVVELWWSCGGVVVELW